MSLEVVPDNTGWEAALQIATEREKNVNRLIKAVLNDQLKTAKLLAKELNDEESTGTPESQYSGPGR